MSASSATKVQLVADPRLVVFDRDVPLLLLNIGPNFVNLDAAAFQIAHVCVHERGAPAADIYQQPHDGVAVGAGHPLGGPDRVSFDQAVDDLGAARDRYAVHWTPLHLQFVDHIARSTTMSIESVDGHIRTLI